jgi:CRP/FNR family transcriptional regulator
MASITLGKILEFDLPASQKDGELSECARCGLRSVFVCSALQKADFVNFALNKSDIAIKAGVSLFGPGEKISKVFNLTEGVLKLSQTFEDGRNQIIAFAFPGDFLGFGLEDHWDHGAEALTPAHLCGFDRDHFQELLKSKPVFKAAFADVLVREISSSRAQLLRLGRKTAVERVASFLLALSEKAPLLGATPEQFFLPMSREDISDFLCLSTETVSRALSRLRRDGMIKTGKGRRVDILDFAALRKIASCRPAQQS